MITFNAADNYGNLKISAS